MIIVLLNVMENFKDVPFSVLSMDQTVCFTKARRLTTCRFMSLYKLKTIRKS